MALPAQEPFTGAAANLADPPWKEIQSSGGLDRFVKKNGSGLGTPADSGGADDLTYWDSDTFNNDQYSQYVAKFTGPGDATQYLYLIARATGTTAANGSWYWFWSDGGSDTALLKHVSGTDTSLASANATTFTTGDVFKLICNGTTISVTKNGATILSVTDSAVTSGAPGMGGSGTSGTVLFDDWQGDNVATATGTTRRRTLMGVGA